MRSALLALILLVATTGCALNRPHPDQRFFTLESLATAAPGEPQSGDVLRVARARVEPPFGTRAVQYRLGPNEFAGDYYHNWADDPGALVTAVAIRTIDWAAVDQR